MLKPFFDWFQELAFSVMFRQSTWLFAIFDAVHLVALTIFAGAVLLVDLRLLGVGVRDRPIAGIFRDAQPWFIGSSIVLFVTGVSMLMGNGEKYYYSDFFWEKMIAVVIAFTLTFTIRRKVALAGEGRVRPIWLRATGLTSIGLWAFVAVWARLIGLV